MRRAGVILPALAGVAVLVGLGLWQLDRRVWKQELLASIDAGLAAPAAELTATPTVADAWRRVSVRGAWPTGGVVRIAPRTLAGKIGGDFAKPIVLQNGAVLVVDLGWAAEGTDVPDLPAGPAALDGVLVPAPEPNLFTPDNRPPDQWLWLDPPAIAAAAGLSPDQTAPVVLRLATSPQGLVARPAKPNLPNDHLHYALTWLALAVALAVIAFLFLRRRPPGGGSGQPL